MAERHLIPDVFRAAIPGLQEAFGAEVSFRMVPAGVVVGTTIPKGDGDYHGVYLIEQEDGLLRVEDDGMTVAEAVACGANLLTGEDQPTDPMTRLLAGHGVHFTDCALMVTDLSAADVGDGAWRLVRAIQDVEAVKYATLRATPILQHAKLPPVPAD